MCARGVLATLACVVHECDVCRLCRGVCVCVSPESPGLCLPSVSGRCVSVCLCVPVEPGAAARVWPLWKLRSPTSPIDTQRSARSGLCALRLSLCLSLSRCRSRSVRRLCFWGACTGSPYAPLPRASAQQRRTGRGSRPGRVRVRRTATGSRATHGGLSAPRAISYVLCTTQTVGTHPTARPSPRARRSSDVNGYGAGTASRFPATMAAKTMAPKSELALNFRRQSARELRSTVTTCHARCAAPQESPA